MVDANASAMSLCVGTSRSLAAEVEMIFECLESWRDELTQRFQRRDKWHMRASTAVGKREFHPTPLDFLLDGLAGCVTLPQRNAESYLSR